MRLPTRLDFGLLLLLSDVLVVLEFFLSERLKLMSEFLVKLAQVEFGS